MKHTLTLIIAAAYLFIIQKASATDTPIEETPETKKIVKNQLPVNAEAEEIMREILAFNDVYKQAKASEKVAPESKVLNGIEETMAEYIADLKKTLPQVEASANEADRQKLLDNVYRKNNPFATYYM